MRLLVVLGEFLVKRPFITQFRDLIAPNAKASVEREMGCKRFDVLVEPAERRCFALYQICEDEVASTLISPQATT